MRRLAVAPVLAGLVLLAPTASAAGPQITDPADDANFVNSQGQPALVGRAPSNTKTPAGSQAYADVLSVQWTTLKTTKVVKVKKKAKKVTTVTGFQVTTTLSAAPKPPEGTLVVYRMLGTTANCGYFGPVWYSKPMSDTTAPQSALRDNCNGADSARLTKLAPPVIKDKVITWTVPLSAIPKDAKVGVGTVLTGLYFTVTEIEDFQGQKVPDNPVALSGARGLGYGVIDDSAPGDAAYKIGS